MCHVTLQDERKHHCLPTAKNMSNLWYFVMTLLWTKNGTETLHFEMQRVSNLHRHQMIDYICYTMPHLNLLIYNRKKVKHEDSGIVTHLTIFPLRQLLQQVITSRFSGPWPLKGSPCGRTIQLALHETQIQSNTLDFHNTRRIDTLGS